MERKKGLIQNLIAKSRHTFDAHVACFGHCILLYCGRTFKEIASAEGSKSVERKKGLIQKLIVSSRHNETGYLMRALQGKLRIGLAEQTVLVALAQAVLLHRQESNIC